MTIKKALQTWYVQIARRWFATRFDLPFCESTNPVGMGTTPIEAEDDYHRQKAPAGTQ